MKIEGTVALTVLVFRFCISFARRAVWPGARARYAFFSRARPGPARDMHRVAQRRLRIQGPITKSRERACMVERREP